MESKNIYEQSHEELVKIRKSLNADIITINTHLLDEQTKDKLLKVITDVTVTRCKEIEKVILGVQ